MNTRMVWKNTVRFWGLWFYIAVSLVLAYYAGGAVSFAGAVGMSLTEYMLYVLTDHYYLVYVWFFFLLFWIIHMVQKNEQIGWIRYGSYQKKYNIDNLAAALQLTLMILGNLILVLCIGLFYLRPSGRFQTTDLSDDFAGNLDVLRGYAEIFPNPAIALVCVVLYWDMGCIFLYLILYYSHRIAGKKGFLLLISLCVISNIVGFTTQIDESCLHVFFFNNYYILHHALLLVGFRAVCVNMAVMIIGYTGIRGMALWRKGILT